VKNNINARPSAETTIVGGSRPATAVSPLDAGQATCVGASVPDEEIDRMSNALLGGDQDTAPPPSRLSPTLVNPDAVPILL
jgi:hypothetical protein